MTEMRLYVDEDASETAVVDGLRARGLDVVSTVEANRFTSSDPDQLAYAMQEERVLYTFNVSDYARLHKEYMTVGHEHCGIVAIPDQRISIGEKIRRIMDFASFTSAEEMRNRMEYL